ncbi:MAG TPA: ribonuclease D [Pseudomonas sabulinigri]|nr:ribonuclease D [Halopseudomonas sabulinigri]HEC50482.1 ribonuclease D [Halopseudomonas sabulinigri]
MIDRNADLASWCAHWLTLPYVAVDTEFVRTETFYPIAGLIQIGDGKRAYLIDPLEITDWAPLVELLQAPDVVKVLHACSEDLEVFSRLCGAYPLPLFDTQLAAAFLGMDFSMGYSRLVSAQLNIDLPKEETRSDWLQRPLSDAQIEYAARDAQHLAELYELLAPRIAEAGVEEWLFADTAEQVAGSGQVIDPELAYQQVKQAWRLNPAQLAILQRLAFWRETESRERDQARNRLVRERALCPLAQQQPDNLQALSRIEDMHPRTVRHDGETLLQLIREGQAADPQDYPERLPEPLPAAANRLLKLMRKIGSAEAERLNIAPEIMLRKKVIEAMLRTGYPNGPYHLPAELVGWRRELLGEALLKVANAEAEEPV